MTIDQRITNNWNSLFYDLFKEHYTVAAPDANHINTARRQFIEGIKGTSYEKTYHSISPYSKNKKDQESIGHLKDQMLGIVYLYQQNFR